MTEIKKDANYATPLWKCESKFDKTIRHITDGIIGALLAVVVVSISVYGLYIWSRG
jgi:hypothetical protein